LLFNLTVARTMWNVLSFNSLPYTDETISNTESEDRI
jgi:hypothetical protein